MSDESTVGIGLALQDSCGDLVKGLSTFERVTFSPRLAKAFASRRPWLKSSHYNHIIIESDCVSTMHVLNQSIVYDSEFDY
ncbi:hypothetical protein J1N35_019508 [Gossypium stocksii]|uniref:RNase H type-1 domain-containing protein n=1 Tax=Gossypium stocksii TaxID=47602 RepID=A0A9D3VR17_9ROSI|nr:hypothetical protein J1N35_019508 [Gossypium stocksii]